MARQRKKRSSNEYGGAKTWFEKEGASVSL
jgi:hypothetical protein